MLNEDLKSAIGRLITNAQATDDTQSIRSDLYDRYMAEPYGDEVAGSSSFLSSDVRDAVEALLPDIMDVFTSAEKMVEFEPVGPEDEEPAKQESEVINNIFWQQNNGYLILYTWVKEALMQQNSYVKSGWREKTRIEIEEYEDLTPDETAQIFNDLQGEYEILESEGLNADEQGGLHPIMQAVDPQTGAPQFAPISMTLRIVTREKRYEIEAVPNEDIFISPRWHSLCLDGVPCVGHRKECERGELLALGFSADSVDAATDEESLWDEAKTSRFDTEHHFDGRDTEDEGDESTRKVTVYESYVRADLDGDGQAELLQVWSIGDGSTILEWEDGTEAVKEVSHQPFSSLTPFIVPHRHVGMSLAELVTDLQHVNTVLIRQTLDNLYRNNHARPYYDESAAGPMLAKDLASPKPGAPVRTGGAVVQWDRPPAVIDATLPMLQTFQDVKEQRTGATRVSQGLNSESLNQHAQGTVAQILDGAAKKRLLICRTFAETGIADLFKRIHRDLRSGPVKQLAMRIRNQWVTVKPRTWRHRTDMTVKVGMGSGDRDKKREFLMLMGQTQEKLMAAGAPIVGLKHIYATAENLAETYGEPSIQEYMDDPAQIPPPDPSQQQPDPQEVLMQAQIQAMQSQAQVEQMKAQTAQMEAQMKAQRMQAELAAEERAAQREYELKLRDLQQKREIASAGFELGADKAVLEDDFKRDKLEADTLTAYNREMSARIKSNPPMPYGEVG